VSGGSDSGAYTINKDPIAYVNTLILQSIAVLPMSYYLYDPMKIFEHDPIKLLSQINLFLLLAGLLSFVCFVLTISGVQSDMLKKAHISRNIAFLGIFGFSLFLLPSLLLSSSPKYQHELTMGIGYLPVYVSYFGISLMIVAFLILVSNLVSRFDNRQFKSVIIIFSLIFSLILTLNYINDSVVVEKVNQEWLYPRALMESGLRNGIFEQVPPGSFLFAQNSYLWDQPEFYIMYGGVKLRGVGLPGRNLNLDKIPINNLSFENNIHSFDQLSNDNVYYLNYSSDSLNEGYAITGRVIRFNATNTTLIDVTSQEIRVYIEDTDYEDHKAEGSHFQINGQWSNADTISGFYPFQIKEGDSRLKLVSSGPGWILYSLRQENNMIDIKSVSVENIEKD
jgi:membrane protease YdiL (CAAX protease family)